MYRRMDGRMDGRTDGWILSRVTCRIFYSDTFPQIVQSFLLYMKQCYQVSPLGIPGNAGYPSYYIIHESLQRKIGVFVSFRSFVFYYNLYDCANVNGIRRLFRK
jgi:hypothetical protein